MNQTPAHDHANPELLAMIPDQARRVVDVGCMHGQLARALHARQPGVHVAGVDIDPAYAEVAAGHCDLAMAGDIEGFDDATFARLLPSDCWVFGDCLEHLRDPWALLRRIRAAIPDDGCLVACVPNAQHWSVQWRLVSGNFRYEDSGLMDRTHIRWFTRVTLLEMFAQTGWHVAQGLTRQLQLPDQDRYLEAVRAFARLTDLDPELAAQDATPFQYVFRVVPQ
ncbi:MAG: class I SAM-dependent methyltransferase [Burkholderiaceae bacterium]